jgi:hypothetical protein
LIGRNFFIRGSVGFDRGGPEAPFWQEKPDHFTDSQPESSNSALVFLFLSTDRNGNVGNRLPLEMKGPTGDSGLIKSDGRESMMVASGIDEIYVELSILAVFNFFLLHSLTADGQIR